MENLQFYGLIFLAYILSGMQSVSGCVTQQFENGNMALELSCPITSFTGAGIWSVDGSQMTSCNSGGFCNTVTNGNYMFTSNSSGIYVMINPYLTTEDGKNWTCNHLLTYCSIIVEPPSESNQPCEGIDDAIVVVVVLDVCPVFFEVIIVIIIVIYDTQKVKITVYSKNKKLKSAKQTINEREQKTVFVGLNTECSIDVRGGNKHQCEFTTDEGVISLAFKIKDDLLNVEPGQIITLPTILTLNNHIDQTTPSIQWFHNKKDFMNAGLYFNTIVKWATYGVYDIKMKFDGLGIMIRIENMRVKARNWTILVICVVVNVSLVVIGGVVVIFKRSTDGFCVSDTFIIIVFVVPICVYCICIPVVCFIYVFFIKRTGNEKSSGTENDQPNDVMMTENGQPNDVMINLKEKTPNE